ncbi:hypothetical protein F8546_003133 [Escherichia coli]|uniref:DUF6216 family protein n=1 Tax=Escherichia coli TaxID=562 RepID=UPI0006A65225|nr:DUF6216 family protein [Escherichia coli]EEQ2895439.1 hypothetical protein [Escherichia coli]EEQ3193311.1 hypothetical protein [Escherichia coli]EEQ5870548.1 hypothetical protein [Escherichia coli]EEQ6440886.1 hypothetical protein [Escherichia coli]EEQ7744346.1 hypothetical protein [Escherichia coli]
MSVMNPISSNIFNAEFLNTPAAALAAWISIIGAAITLVTIVIRALFKYRKSHDVILKKSGIPAFILNFFLIRISLKRLPTITWAEKSIAVLFSLLFLYAIYIFGPVFIQTIRTPPNSTLLYWIKSGESFYISKKLATAATILTTPDWEISKDDCEQSSSASSEKYKSLTIEHKEILCKLLTTDEGNAYIDKAVKKFVKDKFFIYSFTPMTIFILLWLSLGFMLTIHYSKKVRKYILTEQKSAIHWANGEFKTEGIYSIYQELERKTHH